MWLVRNRQIAEGVKMKVGDLVRDTQFKDVGIVVEIDDAEDVYKILFPNGFEWLTDKYVEVIYESR